MVFVGFVHMLGAALWIGGAVAAMVIALYARNESPEVRAGAYRLLMRVHTMVIGLGAFLVVASGLLLTMNLATSGAGAAMAQPRIWVMQAAGLLGGALVLFIGLPTAIRLGAVATPSETGDLPPAFEKYRKRQAVVSSVAGVLVLISLFAAVVLR